MIYSPFRFIPSVFYKKTPIHLTFFVTKRCNARCPFCFYLKNGDLEPKTAEISLIEIQKISKSLGKLLWVSFSGGEIYLRGDLADIAETFYRNNKPSIMLFPTNGLMTEKIKDMTEEILEKCPKSVIVVKLSIDGIGEKHDNLRGIRGSFDKVLETYRALGGLLGKYKNFELGVNTVFTSENQDDMDGIINFVKGLKLIRTHTISLVRGDIDETYKNIDPKKYLDSIIRLEKGLEDGTSPTYRFGGAKIKAAQDIIQRTLIHRTFSLNKRQLPCYAGRLNIVITETGDVYPCENFIDNFKLGGLTDYNYDIIKLLESNRAKDVIHSLENSCFCTHECFMMTNILFNPRLYPALFRQLIRL